MQTHKKILAVDDNPTNLAIIEELLSDQYDLKLVSNGQEALESAHQFQPDLILLDIMMPGIDGYEVCRRIRMSPSLCYTKIIIVSAMAMTSERLKGYKAGADDYITKPFDEDELLAKVRVHLRLKPIKEIEEIENKMLTLSHEIDTLLCSVTNLAKQLMTDDNISQFDRKAIAGQIHDCAKDLHGVFDGIIQSVAADIGKSALEQQQGIFSNSLNEASCN